MVFFLKKNKGGFAPTAYVAQPLWAYSGYSEDAYKCPSLNMYSPADGTSALHAGRSTRADPRGCAPRGPFNVSALHVDRSTGGVADLFLY